ncbi:guanylate-binding protein 1-like [Xenopus laevis]|uniref:Guanylate-binding protein 1-like n=1 Tax=Xenopus laevis TaxID=8355 RepID=A0A8J1L7T4_XENLA|nr:guanylate-binding protein 1-like [Xenopus laevis]
MATFPMEEPMCLIENQESKGLTVNQEALQILLGITQPVVVVAIVGKYRTGKSYLMNKLAGGKNGFELGSTIQSKTKGIWMWCVPHPTKQGHALVLLDTEGLGDVEKGDSKNDAWIFSLAILLSSSLVYNSLGTIDQQAMDNLHYVTELTERIKVKSPEGQATEEDESGEFKRFFPSFIWCVRDFTLKLEKKDVPITEDQYLLDALELKNGVSKRVQDYNLPRRCIQHYFHSHKCFVFDRPASTSDSLQRLEELQESELEPEFVKKTTTFCSYIYEKCNAKVLVGGYTVTGRLLGNLAVSYTEAIRSGSIPCMENAVIALAQIENSRAVQKALAKYEEEMSKNIGKFPTETQEEFLNSHQECEKEATKVFMGLSFKDENLEYQKQLIHELAEKKSKYSLYNEEESAKKCKAILQKLSESLERDISEGKFSKPGGYKQFLAEKNSLVEEYNKTNDKGLKALEILQEFLTEKENVEAAILQADQSLTDKEKEIEEQRAQTEAAEREKQIVEEKNRRLEEEMENQKKCLEDHQKMLEEKMEEEKKKIIEQNEWMIKEKLKEQEDMMSKRFHEESEMLKEQIKDLKKQNTAAGGRSLVGDILAAVLLPIALAGQSTKTSETEEFCPSNCYAGRGRGCNKRC